MYDGMATGTARHALRIEAIRFRLLPPGIQCRAHVAGTGWLKWVGPNEIAGTTGESRRLEAIQFRAVGNLKAHPIIWGRAHVSCIGWQGASDAMAPKYLGTVGKSLQMEAIQLAACVPLEMAVESSQAELREFASSSDFVA